MRKLLLALMLVLSAGVQAQYRYKNIEVTATSKSGVVKADENGFYLTSDSVDYSVSMSGYDVFSLDIHNRSPEPIIVKWKNIWVSNDKDFLSKVDPTSSCIDDIRTGEQKIYPRGYCSFYFPIGGLFGRLLSKKKKTKADILITLIQNGQEKIVSIDFESNPVK